MASFEEFELLMRELLHFESGLRCATCQRPVDDTELEFQCSFKPLAPFKLIRSWLLVLLYDGMSLWGYLETMKQ